MVARALERTIASKAGFRFEKIPKKYVLGAGHVYFFFNKVSFLIKRYYALIRELKFRKFEINPESRNMHWDAFEPDSVYIEQIEWEPSEEEIAINRARINEKISIKPEWYRKSR